MKKIKENRLVVGDKAWAECIPEWLLEEAKHERLILGLASNIHPDGIKIGDAEVCIYLMTTSLRQPLSSDHTEIYMFLTTKLMKGKNKDVPTDIQKDNLTEWQERKLDELRSMIYDKRGGEINHPILNLMRAIKVMNDKPVSQ